MERPPTIDKTVSDTHSTSDSEGNKRVTWGGKLDFILSALGYAVGLGNVWRFPYMAGKNGGAAFMIPYVVMMIFAGFPMFYIEMALGQFSGSTPHLLYRNISPLFQGIGYAMLCVQVFVALYYNMVIAWALYYFVQSFQSRLPYSDCENSWNTQFCYEYKLEKSCIDRGGIYCALNSTSIRRCFNLTDLHSQNYTECWNNSLAAKVTPAEEYWNRRVLLLSDSISDMGTPQWELVVALAVAWLLIFLMLIGGIKTAGKVVYFTATFPYIIIIILIVRGCTLNGAYKGIEFYLIPDTTKLMDAQVWSDAASQIFFSLSVAMGGLPTLASYNDFENNILRDSIIVVIGNCLTSFICGFAIFPIVGHLADETNTAVSELAKEGVGLAFQVYPGALVEIPLPQLWSVLFFSMLIMLGVCTQQVNVEVLITAIVDQFPSLRLPVRRAGATFIICFMFFTVGIVFTCEGGAYLVQLFDKFAAGWNLLIIALAEVVMVAWVYGLSNFIDDIKLMMGVPKTKSHHCMGYPVNIYWLVNWAIITPALLVFVLIFTFTNYERPMYDEYVYPIYAEAIGWAMGVATVLPILICAVWQTHLWLSKFVHKDHKESILGPTNKWIPNNKRAAEDYPGKRRGLAKMLHHHHHHHHHHFASNIAKFIKTMTGKGEPSDKPEHEPEIFTYENTDTLPNAHASNHTLSNEIKTVHEDMENRIMDTMR